MNSELKQSSDVVLTKIEEILVIEVQLYVRMPLPIKFNNGVNLYIEVKSENDIDIVKTEKLKEAYREYFRRPFKSSTIDDSRLVICVATMPVNRNKPIIETFYDKSIFREISEGLQFEELIQKLAYFGS